MRTEELHALQLIGGEVWPEHLARGVHLADGPEAGAAQPLVQQAELDGGSLVGDGERVARACRGHPQELGAERGERVAGDAVLGSTPQALAR